MCQSVKGWGLGCLQIDQALCTLNPNQVRRWMGVGDCVKCQRSKPSVSDPYEENWLLFISQNPLSR